MTFILDRLMASDVEKLIQEAGDFQMEAVKHRCSVFCVCNVSFRVMCLVLPYAGRPMASNQSFESPAAGQV
jgi:hypothetical protein